MLTRSEFVEAQERAAEMIRRAGIPITGEEAARVEVADFGLGRLQQEGAQILTMVATERMAAKIVVLFPNQTLPEHWHPRVGSDPGKEESVRVIWGVVRMYLPGGESIREGAIPAGKEHCYTMRREVVTRPGEQVTFAPGTKHWFQAGEEGAVFFSFSTVSRDLLDEFSDPEVKRKTEIR